MSRIIKKFFFSIYILGNPSLIFFFPSNSLTRLLFVYIIWKKFISRLSPFILLFFLSRVKLCDFDPTELTSFGDIHHTKITGLSNCKKRKIKKKIGFFTNVCYAIGGESSPHFSFVLIYIFFCRKTNMCFQCWFKLKKKNK